MALEVAEPDARRPRMLTAQNNVLWDGTLQQVIKEPEALISPMYLHIFFMGNKPF